MKLEMEDGVAVVRLSRRNLRSLLHKLDMEGSARTLERMERTDCRPLRVIAEDDEEHYAGRVPGPMHPLTESAILEPLDAPERPSSWERHGDYDG